MTESVLTLITDAMQDAGLIAASESPTNIEAQKMFRIVNRMMDSWSTEDLMIYNNVQEVFNLTSGQQSYTIGVGGDFNTSRPVDVTAIYMRDVNGNDLPVQILTYDEYAQIISKPVGATIALSAYYNASSPLSTITFWPVPTATTYRAVIWSWKTLTDFSDLTYQVDMPPGYRDAIVSNLALRGAIAFQAPIPTGLDVWANESKAQLKRINISIPTLKTAGASTGNSTFPISPHILTGY
jgi:hypothetical protein